AIISAPSVTATRPVPFLLVPACCSRLSIGVASLGGPRRATGEPLSGANDSAVFGRVAIVTMRGDPRIPARDPHAGTGCRLLELLADQELQRAEVAVGQVLEATATNGDGGLGGRETLDRAEQVLVGLRELDLHRARPPRLPRPGERPPSPLAPNGHQRPQTPALQA